VIFMKVQPLATPEQRFDLRFPKDKRFDIVGLGQNAVDHVVVVPRFPSPDTKTEILQRERMAGGQVATAVVFAARLGLKSKYIGKVGSDEPGQFCLESLRSENLDISSLIVEPGARNHFSLILLDQSSGERTILWERDPRLNFHSGELKHQDACAGQILLLDENDPEAALQAARWAREEGILVVADLDKASPSSKDLVRLVDFLIVSANFPSEFTDIADPDEALLTMRNHCDGFVAATLGSQGAVAVFGERCMRFPAFKVQAVDTTGAGDVFHGAFIYGLLQNWPLRQIMTFANAAAGLNCTRLGAKEGLPSLAEIMQLIDAQSWICR
jgi:sulfofructose kinase